MKSEAYAMANKAHHSCSTVMCPKVLDNHLILI